MNLSRCPDLDRLNRELIEAYRRIEDRDVFCFDQPNEVSEIHKRRPIIAGPASCAVSTTAISWPPNAVYKPEDVLGTFASGWLAKVIGCRQPGAKLLPLSAVLGRGEPRNTHGLFEREMGK